MIELKNVSLKYVNEFYTLFDITAEFSGNTLIVGDINSGAYSLLRIISKIDKNYEGKVRLDGVDLREIKDKDLDLAYLPHNPVLFNRKSLSQNLTYPLKLRKYGKTEIKNSVKNYTEKYLSLFPQKVNKMNQSQKKMVALVRAAMREPKYILIEDFFSDLTREFYPLAEQIITDLSPKTTIIACENEDNNLPCFADFSRIYLSYGSIKTPKK